MYKQNNSKSKRYNKSSNNKFGQSSGGRGGKRNFSRSKSGSKPNSNWKSKNRRMFSENIHHSKYISKVSKDSPVEKYIPENTFNDFRLNPLLHKNISDRNYINPTKIQDQAIPHIQKGSDILGIASTGSGKTGAFLIPLIDKSLNDPQEKVLIVTPTRELASQIANEFRLFAKETGLRIVLVIGGTSIRDQIRLLKTNPDFVVATPGRLIDIENRNAINLKKFNNVVLDEVDQMLAMGFVDDINTITAKLSSEKQSAFFSATLSSKEEAVANNLLKDPVKVEADKQSPLENIHQDIVKVRSREHKVKVLNELLMAVEFHKVLVFSRTKSGADSITSELRGKGFRADSLHGDKSQSNRSKVLSRFRKDEIDVLVATDVAARGIDVPNISHVINFDEPATYHDYIHRIGRTGRIGKKGTALTFVISKSS